MNIARRLASHAASRNSAASRKSRAAIKDQRRRGFFAERLEDRTLMAADTLSPFHNYSTPSDVDGDSVVSAQDVLAIINSINSRGSRDLTTEISGAQGEATSIMVDVDNDGFVTASDVIIPINYINAHAQGESGSTLPQKASYYLQILDSNGNVITQHDPDDTSTDIRTATIRNGDDFYVQLVGQDMRPPGTDPGTGLALKRGVFSAFTDVLFDTTKATVAANETQTLAFSNTSGSFTLNLGTNDSGRTGTTGAIAYSANSATTITNITTQLNNTLFPDLVAKGKSGVLVTFDSANVIYNVTFVGINNVDLPLMTAGGTNANRVTIDVARDVTGTKLDGAATNTLAAVQYETDATGAARYGADHSANFVDQYGVNDIGGFTGAFSLGRLPLAVLRLHMIASLPAGQTQGSVVFTPDPLGDGQGSTQDMLRPKHNTLVYGNDNVVDPPGSQNTVEIEKSLVQFPETNNEFLELLPVTVAINTGPINAQPDVLNIAEDEPSAAARTVNVLTNDVNNGPPAGALQVLEVSSIPASTGTLSFTPSGNVTFNPAANFNGQFTFTYKVGIQGDSTVDDQTTAQVTVTVAAVNDAPVLTVPGAQTTNEDTAKSIGGISVADADAGAGGVQLTLGVGHGNLTVTASGAAQVTGNNSGAVTITGTTTDVSATLASLSYLPSSNYSGPDSLAVNVTDQGNTPGPALTDSKSVSITVNSVNDAPVNTINGTDANGQHVVAVPFAAGGSAVTTPLTGFNVTDADVGDNLTVTLTPAAGTVSATATGGGNVQGGGTNASPLVISGSQAGVTATLATLAYTPVGGSTTATTLVISSTDAHVVSPTVSTITIDLDPGYRPGPIADSNTALGQPITEGSTTAVTLDVLLNDFIREKDPALSPAVHTTIVVGSLTTPMDSGGTTRGSVAIVQVGGKDEVQYTPPGGDFFTPPGKPVTFTYTLQDDYAGASPDANGRTNAPSVAARTATVSIFVTNTPDIVTNPETFGTKVGGAVVPPDAARNVLSNDNVDKDNAFGDTSYATLSVNPATNQSTSQGGHVTLLANGTFSYTPPSTTFLGDDTFTYVAHETTKDSATGFDASPTTVTIHVASPPVLTPAAKSVTAQEDTALTITIDDMFTDPTEHKTLASVKFIVNGQASSGPITLANGAGSVAIAGDGKSFTYTPSQDFNTTRPPATSLPSFNFIANPSDAPSGGRESNTGTITIGVNEVNDPPTAANDTFLAVKQSADGSIGKDQTVTVLPNDSIAPDVAINGDEFLTVTGVSASAGGPFTATADLGAGGSVKVDGGVVKYTAPQTIPTGGHVTFYYQISDNSAAGRNGPKLASASVDVNIVDFIPKTVSGTVYIDSDGDGHFTTGEKAMAGVTLHLTGEDITHAQVSLTTVSDASGHYTFPAPGSNDVLKPPLDGTSYTVTEDQPQFLLNGLDTYDDSTPNIDTNLDSNNGHTGLLVLNTLRSDNAFLLTWSITDTSGNITDLNFGEGGINTNPNDGGLSNASGFKSELLASTGKNGFIAAINSSGQIVWSWTLEGDVGAWSGHSLSSALLAPDFSTLDVEIDGGLDITLTQGYYSSTSTARFRILGSGIVNGETQYIIRIDGSYDGSAGVFNSGMTDAMFQVTALQNAGAHGEAPSEGEYVESADAVFAQQAWA